MVVVPGIISNKCWRDLLVVQKISLLEIISTAVLPLAMVVVVVVDLSRVFHVIDSAALQPVHRCTPAPCGTLAVPAALPTQMTHTLFRSMSMSLCNMLLAPISCSDDSQPD